MIEAFVEMYHLMRTHPELHRLIPMPADHSASRGTRSGITLTSAEAVNRAADYLANLCEGMGGLVHAEEIAVIEPLRALDYPEDPDEATGLFFARAREAVARDGAARGLPMFDIERVNAEHPLVSNEHFFPNFFLLPQFTAMASYRVRPLSPESCLFEIWSLKMVPEGEDYMSPKEPTVLPYDSPDYPLIVRQDYINMPRQQLGLRSGEIEFQRLSREQEGMISNFQRLIDGFLAGLDNDLLVGGQHVVNGGSFGPIRDLGFGATG